MTVEQEVQFEFICVELPDKTVGGCTDLRLGMQQGKIVVDDAAVDEDPQVFRFAMRVRDNAKTGKPNFLGPYANGTPAERFVYLCWGQRDGDAWRAYGRAKVQLKEISWEQVNAAIEDSTPIRATIRMQDNKGRPLTASVKSENITWEQ